MKKNKLDSNNYTVNIRVFADKMKKIKRKSFNTLPLILLLIIMSTFVFMTSCTNEKDNQYCVYGALQGNRCGAPTKAGASYCPTHQSLTDVYD